MKDIRLDIYVSAETWLALRHRCEQQDRSMSHHVRLLIRQDLEKSVAEIRENLCGKDAGNEIKLTVPELDL